MNAQDSFFLVWGTDERPLDVQLGDQCYCEIPHKPQKTMQMSQGILYQITIPHEEKQNLFRELDLAGVNEASLFPGLDGIGRYVDYKYSFNYQEAIDIYL
jgi:hypothetical protein